MDSSLQAPTSVSPSPSPIRRVPAEQVPQRHGGNEVFRVSTLKVRCLKRRRCQRIILWKKARKVCRRREERPSSLRCASRLTKKRATSHCLGSGLGEPCRSVLEAPLADLLRGNPGRPGVMQDSSEDACGALAPSVTQDANSSDPPLESRSEISMGSPTEIDSSESVDPILEDEASLRCQEDEGARNGSTTTTSSCSSSDIRSPATISDVTLKLLDSGPQCPEILKNDVEDMRPLGVLPIESINTSSTPEPPSPQSIPPTRRRSPKASSRLSRKRTSPREVGQAAPMNSSPRPKSAPRPGFACIRSSSSTPVEESSNPLQQLSLRRLVYFPTFCNTVERDPTRHGSSMVDEISIDASWAPVFSRCSTEPPSPVKLTDSLASTSDSFPGRTRTPQPYSFSPLFHPHIVASKIPGAWATGWNSEPCTACSTKSPRIYQRLLPCKRALDLMVDIVLVGSILACILK